MRVCVVYDCLFPHTVGGAERWYRNLAERLAAEGHEVTYLTLRQWDRRETPELAGDRARVVSVGPRMGLYTADGRRRILPPLVFGLGVLWHTCWCGAVAMTSCTRARSRTSRCSPPRCARPLGRYELEVDWFEVWSGAYWREYLGGAGGRVGELVQRACARVRQRAFCFSRLHAQRLREEGLHGEVTVLRGLYAGTVEQAPPRPADEVVLFAARLIPEKQAPRSPWRRSRSPETGSRGCGARSSGTDLSARR